LIVEGSERRKYPRINIERAIYVEVVRRGSMTEADNPIIRCETLDVSMGGLRIWVPEQIAQGSVLNIAAPMEDWKENLELVGKAMWVRAAEDKKGYWVGLELMDSSREDMERWFIVVKRLSA
jgi:c-di-GMP-binding flagellar brake protein YcgR